jgi:carbamoyl-phosphate synthase large subunit
MNTKKTRFNILLLGGIKRIGLAKKFLGEAKKRNLLMKIYSYELNYLNLNTKVIIPIKGLKWSNKKIISDLKKKILQLNIKLVIANTDEAVIILSKLKYLKNCSLVSDLKTAKNSFNKEKINNLLKNHNIDTTSSVKGFPMIAKPKFGSNSKSIAIIHNKNALKNFNKKKYIFEKYLRGVEYSVDCYISPKFGIIGIVPRVRNEITGGEATLTTSENNIKLSNIAEKIIIIMNYIGPVNLQFIKYNKKYYFMEANPRLSGGVLAAIKSGLNVPSLMLNDILEHKQKKLEKIKCIKMYKYFTEYYENNN